jgi:hypothetical protein
MTFRARNVFRDSINRLLATNPTQAEVKTRLASLVRLHDELVRFVDWPALHDSFLRDIEALRAVK